MIAFETFEQAKFNFDELVDRYNSFVNQQRTLINTAANASSSACFNQSPPSIDTSGHHKTPSTGSSSSSHSPNSQQISPNQQQKSASAQAQSASAAGSEETNAKQQQQQPPQPSASTSQLQAVLENATGGSTNLKNVPPVGILRAQQYESIASNMHMFNSPDARKCSISFDRELSRGDISQNQTVSYDEEAINILNIFIRNNETKTDDEALVSISLILQSFTHTKVKSRQSLLRPNNSMSLLRANAISCAAKRSAA